MAGHSQFANIKHRKDAQDNKRAKKFIKIIKEIKVAVQKGGTDLTQNATLRNVIAKAKALNMPKDKYLNAINKNDKDVNNYEYIIYESYLWEGSSIIISCLTDNKNRTAANIKNYLNKMNFKLAHSNSVLFLYNFQGVIRFESSDYSEDDILELLLEHNINDLNKQDARFIIYCNPKNILEIVNILKENNINNIKSMDPEYIPFETIKISNENIEKSKKLIETLSNDDDVENYYYNFK